MKPYEAIRSVVAPYDTSRDLTKPYEALHFRCQFEGPAFEATGNYLTKIASRASEPENYNQNNLVLLVMHGIGRNNTQKQI